ncbi:MAG: non-canonical purine NTP pyrophosphatase [Saprospiraceae bacterium]|nr:non-canonical purine NTP pyrophosphatase [Saprospiraceae bacterium]
MNDILRGATPFVVVTKSVIGCHEELPETTGTIRGNAIQKAQYLFDKYGVDCFSEDTGLEIDALDGEPGVDTAFYSGSRDAVKNMTFVLEKMGNTTHRTARFRTVIALILRGSLHTFEGVCEGVIRTEISNGTEGFGYDPLFQPEGYDLTFAELNSEVKNQISHRARATYALLAFLKKDF